MPVLKLQVKGSSLKITQPFNLVSTQQNYDSCEFSFDSSWDGYAKTAIFYSDTTSKKSIELVDNKCVIPWESLVNDGILFIGVFGVKGTSVLPTNFVEQPLIPGSYVGADPTQPTQDIYIQLISAMNSFRDEESARVIAENARVSQEIDRQTNTQTAITNANNATDSANGAATNANNAASNANDKATLANNAATNANNVATQLSNETLIIWKPYVATYADIATTYPTPEIKWTTIAQDTGIRWRYNGTEWVNIGVEPTDKVGDLTQLPTTDKTNTVNSIKELNTQLASTASQTSLDSEKVERLSEVAVERGRIDNIVTSAGDYYIKCLSTDTGALLVISSGATTGQINLASITPKLDTYTPIAGDYVRLVSNGIGAETTDIRTGTDGTVYANAGNAVRGQTNELKGIDDGIKLLPGAWAIGNITQSTGVYSSSVKYRVCTPDIVTINSESTGTFTINSGYTLVIIPFVDGIRSGNVVSTTQPVVIAEGTYKFIILKSTEDTGLVLTDPYAFKSQVQTKSKIYKKLDTITVNIEKLQSASEELKSYHNTGKQFLDYSTFEDGYYYSLSGNSAVKTAGTGYQVCVINNLPAGTYKFNKYKQYFCLVENISTGVIKTFNSLGLTTETDGVLTLDYAFNLYYTCRTITDKLSVVKPMMINGDEYPPIPVYGEYGVHTAYWNVNMKADGTGDFTDLASAIANIPTTLTDLYQVNINLEDGTYSHSQKHNVVYLPSNVNIIGVSGNRENCIIQGALANSASDDDITLTSTFDIIGNNTFKNVTITAKNERYAIHSESGGVTTDWTQILENCVLIHYGNNDAIQYRKDNSLDYSGVWLWWHAWGEGASSGSKLTMKNCYIYSDETCFYVHSPSSNVEKPYYHELINCILDNPKAHSYSSAVTVSANISSAIVNTVILRGCQVDGSIVMTGTDKVNIFVDSMPVPVTQDTAFTGNNFPIFTGRTIKLKYTGTALIGGELLKYNTDGTVSKSDSSTDVKQIAGYAVGTASDGGSVTVMTLPCYYQMTPSYDYYNLADNGALVGSATKGTATIGYKCGTQIRLVQ